MLGLRGELAGRASGDPDARAARVTASRAGVSDGKEAWRASFPRGFVAFAYLFLTVKVQDLSVARGLPAASAAPLAPPMTVAT